MVSYEYVARQDERNGTLIMSQYAGAAKMLGSALLINPWDTPRFAKAIHKALTMPLEERQNSHSQAAEVARHWNV